MRYFLLQDPKENIMEVLRLDEDDHSVESVLGLFDVEKTRSVGLMDSYKLESEKEYFCVHLDREKGLRRGYFTCDTRRPIMTEIPINEAEKYMGELFEARQVAKAFSSH